MKFIFIYFLFFLTIFSRDIYIPKDKNEESILKKYRKEKLTLGLCDSNFKNDIYKNNSLNLLLEDLLINYLQLNIQVVKNQEKILLKDYETGKIDIMGYLIPGKKITEYSSFSIPLYPQELYLASNENNLLDLKNTKNIKIYTSREFRHNKSIKRYLEVNNIHAKLKYKNINEVKNNDFYIGVDQEIIKFNHKKRVGNLPDPMIAVQKKYDKLIPIINNALNERYHKKIMDFLDMRRTEIYKEKFINSLTFQEKKYLETLKPLSIELKNIPKICTFSKSENRYVGSLPLTLDEISKGTGIKFNFKKYNKENLNEKYKEVMDGQLDLFPMKKNQKNRNLFALTDQIDHLTFYKITSYDFDNNYVGILNENLSKKLVKEYYLDEDIRVYKNIKSLEKALKEGKVSSVFLLCHDRIDTTKYKVQVVDRIPIYLGLDKKKVLLKNILDKAIENILNKDEIRKEAKTLSNYDNYLKNKNKEKNSFVSEALIVGSLLVFIYFFKLAYIKKTKKESLIDIENKINFHEFKNDNKKNLGWIILIDISKNIEINNQYDYFIENGVVSKILKILNNIFMETSIYRIAENRFIIYLKDSNIEKYLKRLKKQLNIICKNDKNAYGLNIGYYNRKREDISLEEVFIYTNMVIPKGFNCFLAKEATKDILQKKKRENLIKKYLMERKLQGVYPVYQPKFSILTNEIIGGETLARWKVEELGFISPGEFIPIAESLNLVYLIDYIMAEESIRVIKSWKETGLINNEFKLSFNLSMQTFEREDVVIKLKKLLEKYDVLGSYLEVEVTESILSSNLEKTLKKLEEIKELGIEISIDDFTAGHSTAGLLPYLPVDIVKFDKSILDIVTKENSYNNSIYKNLINLVKDLHLKIVAEGIETKYQLEFLKENKVDIGQGFLFSKPLIKEEFEALKKR